MTEMSGSDADLADRARSRPAPRATTGPRSTDSVADIGRLELEPVIVEARFLAAMTFSKSKTDRLSGGAAMSGTRSGDPGRLGLCRPSSGKPPRVNDDEEARLMDLAATRRELTADSGSRTDMVLLMSSSSSLDASLIDDNLDRGLRDSGRRPRGEDNGDDDDIEVWNVSSGSSASPRLASTDWNK